MKRLAAKVADTKRLSSISPSASTILEEGGNQRSTDWRNWT